MILREKREHQFDEFVKNCWSYYHQYYKELKYWFLVPFEKLIKIYILWEWNINNYSNGKKYK